MGLVESIGLAELEAMPERMYGELVKGVVDVRRRIMALDAELHADEEFLLLERGSPQFDLWGIDPYPEDYGTPDFIEFDSVIDIRPSRENRSRSVEDEALRQEVAAFVGEIVHEWLRG